VRERNARLRRVAAEYDICHDQAILQKRSFTTLAIMSYEPTRDPLFAALQAEYLQLQKTIEDFDARALTIKAWSVTFGLTALAGAFASHSRVVFLIASSSAALFWYLETTWKVFQQAYYSRSAQLEQHFRGETRLEDPFQISSAWYNAWSRMERREYWRVALWPHVALPHAIVVATGLVLYFVAALKILAL
jgi:hypothetical protein